jgi:hypothetical protein
VIYGFCVIRAFEENNLHTQSIAVAEGLLKQGQTNIVITAFETYSSIEATDSTFQASAHMLHDLSIGEAK